MLKFQEIRFLVTAIFIIIVTLFLGNNIVKEFFWLLCALILVNCNILLVSKKYIYTFFLPVPLIINYISISLLFGSISFFNNIVGVQKDLEHYLIWSNFHITSSIYFSIITVFAFSGQTDFSKYSTFSHKAFNFLDLFLIVPWFIFFVIPLNLDFFGGDGDLAITIKSTLAIFLFLSVQKYRSGVIRLVSYSAIILFFATFSIEEKREAIFLVLPCMLLEYKRSMKGISYGLVRNNLIIGIILVLLILAMSIGRGYGQFGSDLNLFESFRYVFDYVKDPFFLAYFLNNIEVNYMFFHAFNSMEMVINDSSLVSYGSTLIKPLFLPFPRELFPWKPKSIIDLYTTIYSPEFRSEGGSWVIPFFSELFWNFGYLVLIPTYLFSRLMRAYSSLLLKYLSSGNHGLKSVFLLYTYTMLFTFVRGSGLDQFIIYLLISLFVLVYLKLARAIFLR